MTSQWAATTVLKHVSLWEAFPPFPTTKPQHRHRTLPRRRTGHFKRHAQRKRQQKIYRGFFRRGVVRSCSVMVEEYSTIAERFLITPRRKNRAIFTQNAPESLLILQPLYDRSKDTYDFKSTKNPPRID